MYIYIYIDIIHPRNYKGHIRLAFAELGNGRKRRRLRRATLSSPQGPWGGARGPNLFDNRKLSISNFVLGLSTTRAGIAGRKEASLVSPTDANVGALIWPHPLAGDTTLEVQVKLR